MSVVIQHGDCSILLNVADNTRVWLLAVGVDDGEVVTKVHEQQAKQAFEIHRQKAYVVSMGELVELDQVLQGQEVGDHDDLELGQGRLAEVWKNRNRHIMVQFLQLRSRHFVNLAAYVVFRQEELCRQVAQLHGGGVVQRQRLDAGQSNVLSNFNAYTFQSDYQDVGVLHFEHGFFAKHVELSGVQSFVNSVRWRVYLHISHVGKGTISENLKSSKCEL